MDRIVWSRRICWNNCITLAKWDSHTCHFAKQSQFLLYVPAGCQFDWGDLDPTFYYLRWLRDFGGKIYTIEIPENTRNTFQILGRSSVNTPLMNSESKDLDLRKVWAAMSCYRFFCLFLTRKQLFGIQQTKEPKHMHLGWSEYHLYWPFSLPQGDVERPHFEAVTTLSDSQAIRSVDFHPNGKLYAVGSNSKTFRICQYPQLSKLR